jgi:hypothetical protein
MLAFEYGGVGGKFEGQSDPQVIESQSRRIVEILNIPPLTSLLP